MLLKRLELRFMAATAVIAGTAMAAAIWVASPAIADAGEYPGNDAAFFSYEESNGNPVGTDELQDALRELAGTTCRLFDEGGTATQAIQSGVQLGLTAREVQVTNVGAVNFYCPWNRAALNS
jgi:hypothetical protein